MGEISGDSGTVPFGYPPLAEELTVNASRLLELLGTVGHFAKRDAKHCSINSLDCPKPLSQAVRYRDACGGFERLPLRTASFCSKSLINNCLTDRLASFHARLEHHLYAAVHFVL